MMNNQSELIVERPRSFIRPSMAEIRGSYLELNLSQTRVQCSTRVRVWKHPTWSSRFKSHVSTSIKSHVSTTIESRVLTIIESRISTIIENRILTQLKFVSAHDQRGGRVYESW